MLNIIAIGSAAFKDDINAVLEAHGRGPGSLSRKATTEPGPTWDATPTHFYMSDQGVTEDFVMILHGFAEGVLPPLPPGTVWGEEGVIGEAEAIEAIDGANFKVFTSSGDVSPPAQVAAALGAEGLHAIPDPEP